MSLTSPALRADSLLSQPPGKPMNSKIEVNSSFIPSQVLLLPHGDSSDFFSSQRYLPFFFFFFFYLWWILSYIEMKQPRVYMCSPSQSPLPPPSPPIPARFSQCTRSEHLSHASNLADTFLFQNIELSLASRSHLIDCSVPSYTLFSLPKYTIYFCKIPLVFWLS